jgi:hypothetical protein
VHVLDLGSVRRRSLCVAVGALFALMGPVGAAAVGATPVSRPTAVRPPGTTVPTAPAKKARKHRVHKKAGRKSASAVVHRGSAVSTSSSTTSPSSTSTTSTTVAKLRAAGFGSARPHRKTKVPTVALTQKPASSRHGLSTTALLAGFFVVVPMLILALVLIGTEVSRRPRSPRRDAGSWIVQ